jgi:hypothetical protein
MSIDDVTDVHVTVIWIDVGKEEEKKERSFSQKYVAGGGGGE